MRTSTTSTVKKSIVYPDTDGLPMAESTLQCDWIILVKCGLDLIFEEDLFVFIAADNFWYPVEGDPKIRVAPDVYVVFGRPKGHRGSYKQWEEGGIAPQVVFEILSPGNRRAEMAAKLRFYEKYGVEEYYVYDPVANLLKVYVRRDGKLQLEPLDGRVWVSPRMGVRFELTDETLILVGPDGRRFRNVHEREQELREQVRLADDARRRADEAELRRARETERVERLLAKLRESGIDPDLDEVE